MLIKPSILALCCALPLSVLHAEDCPTHAQYDTNTRKLTIPFVDVPLLEPWTGNMTNEVAVFSAELELLKGVEDFHFRPNMFQFLEIADAYDKCHARYTYADGKFDNGGWLYIPFVDVPLVMVVPPNIQQAGPVHVFQATLRQLAIDSEVFHLYTYCDADEENCNTISIGQCDGEKCDDEEECDGGECPPPTCPLEEQAQLKEAFDLYTGIMPMVIAEYDISGGEWPIPLENVITVPTGVYTETFVSGEPPLYIDAIMKTDDEGVSSCFANETIRFIFDPELRTWSCRTNIPEEYLTLFPMDCQHPL